MTVLNQTDITKIIAIQDDMETSRHVATQRKIVVDGRNIGFVTYYRKSNNYHVYMNHVVIQKNARALYDYLTAQFGTFELVRQTF